jgi:uncharacterized protein YbaP (TraB family)
MAAQAVQALDVHRGRLLLVAGAAHFAGDDGIQNLLARGGLDVKQVSAAGDFLAASAAH